jgi:hypothetical protein
MCAECIPLDKIIVRFRHFLRYGLDDLTIERLTSGIAELQKQKEALHCGGR